MRTIKVGVESVGPGDTVLIRADVVRAVPGVGVLVQLFSTTDEYEAWVRYDLLHPEATRVEVLPEPPDGTWLLGEDDEGLNTFGRLDDRVAKYHHTARRWLDVRASEWVTWEQAYRRGADPDRPIKGLANTP